LFPEKNIYTRAKRERIESFDKIFGTADIRHDLVTYTRVDDMLAKMNVKRAEFNKKREKYLLYE
jgi:uncharacterized protein YbbC (DUF1343 family)